MGSSFRQRCDEWQVGDVLRVYQGLSLRPSQNSAFALVGYLAFSAAPKGLAWIDDVFSVAIDVPEHFPQALPEAQEKGGRIPATFHTNPGGGLCLGSPLRLFMLLHARPTLCGFVESCLVPFLYGFSYWERHGRLPFGELAHGNAGIVQDYMRILRVQDEDAVRAMLKLLGMKKRIANKRRCPCGSGRRVGKCHNRWLNPLRVVQSRPWYREQVRELGPSPQPPKRDHDH